GGSFLARGHRVTLVANEHYQALAKSQGFSFRALGSIEETNTLLNNPDSWHPRKSLSLGRQWAVAAVERHYGVLAELAQESNAVFVASPVIFAARLVQEKFERHLVTILLQPWIIRS